MGTRGTTICCSAVALSIAASIVIQVNAEQARPFPQTRASRLAASQEPLSLFPVGILWTLDLNNLLTAPPGFDTVRGYFPIEGDRLAAYDLLCGERLWLTSIATTTRPAAGSDLVFIAGVATIDALRAIDGSPSWQQPLPDPLAAPLTWDSGWLLAATTGGSILAYRASDGHQVWRHHIGSPAHASPTLAADRVYVPTEDGRVVALRLDNGEPVWERRLGGTASDILALDERLYVGSNDNFFYCLKTKDGEQAWRYRTGGDVIGMPAVDERNVFFVALDNLLRAVDRTSGNQRWRRPLPHRPTAGPVKTNDLLLTTAVAQTLPAYKTTDGAPEGEVMTGNELSAPPHIATLAGIFGPVVITVSSDIAKGAIVIAQSRTIEPNVSLTLPVFPHPLTPDGTPLPAPSTTLPKP